MKLPRSVNIKGKRWDIREKHKIYLGEQECDGLCHTDTRRIDVNRDLPPEIKWQKLIHEILHAGLHELHVPMDETIEEVVVDGLSTILCEAFEFKRKRKKVPKT